MVQTPLAGKVRCQPTRVDFALCRFTFMLLCARNPGLALRDSRCCVLFLPPYHYPTWMLFVYSMYELWVLCGYCIGLWTRLAEWWVENLDWMVSMVDVIIGTCVYWVMGMCVTYSITVHSTHGVFPHWVFLENSPSCYLMFSGQDFVEGS